MLESESFWALVSLIIFFAILFVYRLPSKVNELLDKRTARIRAELDEARRNREEAQSLLAEYQRKRRDAEAEAEHIIEDARKEARRLTDEANTKLREMVERRTKAAENKIAQAEQQAIAEVRNRAAELAVTAAADVLRDKLTGEKATALIDSSIDTVRQRMN